jgi:hypothetical protein
VRFSNHCGPDDEQHHALFPGIARWLLQPANRKNGAVSFQRSAKKTYFPDFRAVVAARKMISMIKPNRMQIVFTCSLRRNATAAIVKESRAAIRERTIAVFA